jgi:putative tricarboxylic transport membrane protein
VICLVLGLVLGEIAESNFHRAFIIGRGSYWVFVKSNISIILFTLTVLSLTGPYIIRLFKKSGIPRKT